jgi:integrase
VLALGAYPEVSLKAARERLFEARKLKADGVDPMSVRAAAKAAQAVTFEMVASDWLVQHKAKQTPATYKKSVWLLSLMSSLNRMPIRSITGDDILDAAQKIEARGRNESAHRAVQKVGQVFRWALTARRKDKLVEADPTVSLRGALQPVKTKHHPGITEPRAVGALLRAIDGYTGQPSTRMALKLAPLVFVRPGELRGAVWDEFDLDAAQPEWRIPAERMKMKDAHVVPLSRQAVAILRDLQRITEPSGLLFPSLTSNAKPISENTLNAALRRLGYSKEEHTSHGFRTTASTNLNELGHSGEFVELQLSHEERNKVRAAYNRAKHLEQRRKLMQDWADYLDGLKAGDTVVPFKRKA